MPLTQTEYTSLSCKNLTASYKKMSPVLNDVSVCINRGEFVCIAGPNGGGKSSLLAILAGLEGGKHDSLKILNANEFPSLKTKNSNSIIESPELPQNKTHLTAQTKSQEKSSSTQSSTRRLIDTNFCTPLCESENKSFNTQEIRTLKRKECAKIISFMTQSEESAWDSSVIDTILTGRYAFSGTSYNKNDIELAKNSAELLGIKELLNRGVQSLSGGEFQKVRIARTLAQNTPFILLDEPCTALDISYEPILLEKLKNLSHEQNKGILISLHNLNMASRFADRLILLPKSARQITGAPNKILTKENLKKTYNANLKTYIHPVYNCPQIL